MMAVLSILLLLLLTRTHAATGLFQKAFISFDTKFSWDEARRYCRNQHIDLLIIETQSEFDSFMSLTESVQAVEHWIGLKNNPGETNFTHWCDGTALRFLAWESGQPNDPEKHNCVVIQNNVWDDKDCAHDKMFFCYGWAPEMIVVQRKKTWEEALLHCRKHYTDLISITTETDHFLVNNRSNEILTPTFWTGLRFMHGSWFWVNREPLGSLNSLPSCPARPYRCGARNINDGVWENRDCEEKMNFICYHDVLN